MTKTNLVQVVIGGRVLTMGGSEDELHSQKVAACVNRKLQELEETESYRGLPADLKPVLVELNLAEDLIHAQEECELLEGDLHLKETELAKIKQDLVEAQMELERREEDAVRWEEERKQFQETVNQLQAQLKAQQKKNR